MKLLDTKQAAKALSISMPTLYKLIKTGGLQYVKIGRTYRIPLQELEKWTAENTVKCGDNDNEVDI